MVSIRDIFSKKPKLEGLITTLKEDINNFSRDFKGVENNVNTLVSEITPLSEKFLKEMMEYYEGWFSGNKIPEEKREDFKKDAKELEKKVRLLHRYLRFVSHKIKEFNSRIKRLEDEVWGNFRLNLSEEEISEEIRKFLDISIPYFKLFHDCLEKICEVLDEKVKQLDKQARILGEIGRNIDKGIVSRKIAGLIKDYLSEFKDDAKKIKEIKVMLNNEEAYRNKVQDEIKGKAFEEYRNEFAMVQSIFVIVSGAVGLFLFKGASPPIMGIITSGIMVAGYRFSTNFEGDMKEKALQEAEAKFKHWEMSLH
jgi:hypothetical protein